MSSAYPIRISTQRIPSIPTVAVVVAFFLCWAPFHAQRLVAIYGSGNDHLDIYVVMTYISGILYYLSTCINPLLYNLMSNKFREAFKVDRICTHQMLGTWHRFAPHNISHLHIHKTALIL